MSADRKAQIAQVNDEIWNQGNMDAVARLFAPNIVRHQPPMPDVVGLEAVTQYIRDIRSAYSQLRLQIHDLIIDGDISASRFTIEAMHTGNSPTLPVAPTGKPVVIHGAGIWHWEDGRVIEEWTYNDYLGLMQQLGIISSAR